MTFISLLNILEHMTFKTMGKKDGAYLKPIEGLQIDVNVFNIYRLEQMFEKKNMSSVNILFISILFILI